MKFLLSVIITALIWVLLPSLVSAQTPVKNPTLVIVPACPDHDQDTGHEIEILTPQGSSVQVLQVGDPPREPNGEVRFQVNVQPIKFGQYVVVVRATAGAVKSDNSPPSDAWERVPGAPSKPAVQ
jgi:hypothetical protein